MSCEIIAEVANSHQGEFHLAKIETFSSYGATSIKFQIYFCKIFIKDHERFNIKINLCQKKNGLH